MENNTTYIMLNKALAEEGKSEGHGGVSSEDDLRKEIMNLQSHIANCISHLRSNMDFSATFFFKVDYKLDQ